MNRCLSPLMLWVRFPLRVWSTTLCDKGCQWLPTGWWFSPGPPVSSTNHRRWHDRVVYSEEVRFLTRSKLWYLNITESCIVFDNSYFIVDITWVCFSRLIVIISSNEVLERVHLKFCKILLNLKSSTPNYMVYGELGRYPIDILYY
jgi:hypothetical protein